jgi:4-amino-4-deoxy-L-arabinose transferase-like glycosyltransferase
LFYQLAPKGKEEGMPVGQKVAYSPVIGAKAEFLPPLVLAVFTLVTRLLFHGLPYFADGPAHLSAIVEKVYIIQPPGYWLFNRIGGLFSDPVIGISTMNIFFSVAGVVVFYFTALFFAGRRSAFLAALAYSCIFYVWFSGEVHSTYASQALFPVATFCALLHYERDKANWLLWTAAAVFAVGAGLRPSDGVFLLPMVLYYSAVRLTKGKAALFLAFIIFLCLGWIIPTVVAFSHAPGGIRGVLSYTHSIATQKSITSGVNGESMANIARYVLPLLVAFWPVLAAAVLNLTRNWRDWRVQMLALWIVPGSLFFVLSYISDAPYLNFLSAAILLLAVGAPRMMAVTAVWNAIVFLGFSPIPSRRLPVNIWNCYVGHFTSYGVRHQWWPNLSALQGSRVIIPGQPEP